MVQRKLPDMTMQPDEDAYRPPEGGGELVFPIDLGAGISIVNRMLNYRSWVVDFSISTYFEEDEIRHCIARIDCCWGTVHRHRYNRDGDDEFDHEVIHRIIKDGTQWDQINSLYHECYDRVLNEAVEAVRRWRDGH